MNKKTLRRSVAGIAALVCVGAIADPPAFASKLLRPIVSSAADTLSGTADINSPRVSAPVTIRHNGYFYGKINSGGVMEITVDADGTELSYQWVRSDIRDGEYAPASDYYADLDPDCGMGASIAVRDYGWYKCIVTDIDGNSAETKPLLLTDTGIGRPYISNGSMAYSVWNGGFDLREYFKTGVNYFGEPVYSWVNSTYSDGGWNFKTLYVGEDGESIVSSAAPEKFFFTFDENAVDVVIPHLVLAEGQSGFAMGCDVYVNGNDYAALTVIEKDGYSQFQLIDSTESFEYMGDHPEEFSDRLAIVLKTYMKPSEYYIGCYYDATDAHFRFNCGEDDLPEEGSFLFDSKGHVVQASGIDSGINISWRGLEAGVEYVPFDSGLGSAENLGAVLSATANIRNVLLDANGIVSVTEDGTTELELSGSMRFGVNHRYTIVSAERLRFDGYVGEVDEDIREDGCWVYEIKPETILTIDIVHDHDIRTAVSSDGGRLLRCCIDELEPVTETLARLTGPENTLYGEGFEFGVLDGDGAAFGGKCSVFYCDRSMNVLSCKPAAAGNYVAVAEIELDGAVYTLTKNFTIGQKYISRCEVSFGSRKYDGKTTAPAVTVTDGGKLLTEGVDYIVKGSGSAVGTYEAEVCGIGSYKGSVSGTWIIENADLPEFTVIGEPEKMYDGTPYEFSIEGSFMPCADVNICFYRDGVPVGMDAPVIPGSYSLVVSSGCENYNTRTVTLEFVIKAQVITVMPEDVEVVYGAPVPVLRYTVTGCDEEDEEFFADMPEILTAVGFSKARGAAGSYAIAVNEEYAYSLQEMGFYELRLGREAVLTVLPVSINDPAVSVSLSDSESGIAVSYDGNIWGSKPTEGVDYVIAGATEDILLIDADAQGLSGNYSGSKLVVFDELAGEELPDAAEVNYSIADTVYGEEIGFELDTRLVAELAGRDAGALHVNYRFFEDGRELADVPSDAGTYKAVAVVSANGCAAKSYEAEFTIAPKTVSVIYSVEDAVIVYGEDDPEAVVTIAAVEGVINGDDPLISGGYRFADAGETVRPAGKYGFVGGFISGNKNYTAEAVCKKAGVLTVAPKEIAPGDFAASEVVYYIDPVTGTACVSVSGTDGGKALVPDRDFVLMQDVIAYETGVYTVEVVGIGNYTGSAELRWKVTTLHDEVKAAMAAELSDSVSICASAKSGCISLVTNRVIPAGYKVVESGIICVSGVPSGELTVESGGVIKVGCDDQSSVGTYSALIHDKGAGVTARGFVTVEKDGCTVTVYSESVFADNAALADAADRQAAMAAEIGDCINIGASVTGAQGKVLFVANSMIPSGYKVLESGIVCRRGNGMNSDEELVMGAEGVKTVSSTKPSVVGSYKALIPDKGDGVTARGYVKIEKDGVVAVVYTGTIYADYASLRRDADLAEAAGLVEEAGKYISISGSVDEDGKLIFTVDRALPEGFEVRRSGMVCVLGETELSDEEFIVGAEGVKFVSAAAAEPTGRYSARLVNKNGEGIAARGYMQIVRDGLTVDVYTDIIYIC